MTPRHPLNCAACGQPMAKPEGLCCRCVFDFEIQPRKAATVAQNK